MACYREIGEPDGLDPVLDDDGNLWVMDSSPLTIRGYTIPDFISLTGHTPTPSSGFGVAGVLAADDGGNLYWAEHDTIAPAGQKIWRWNGISDSLVASLIDPLGIPLFRYLRWNPHDGRIYYVLAENPGASDRWLIGSIETDGSDEQTHLSGINDPEPVTGPLVFDADGISLWCRIWTGSLYTIGHIDLRDWSTTTDPASLSAANRWPGIPRPAGGLIHNPNPLGPWDVVTFDDPGFTVAPSGCPDETHILEVAYSADYQQTAFISFTSPLAVWIPGGRWHVGFIGSRS